ncbi:hypothetical protein JG687_00015986 [Phytophthora cactorum]|uniref:Uncharacterized protein n=1 Tax=Phytophthora cactorum TaxID=29920 RepID=A0A8T1TUG5_9STRA|nr:hypothetical protein JG687_00015986 [Phytophthora cactorum]
MTTRSPDGVHLGLEFGGLQSQIHWQCTVRVYPITMISIACSHSMRSQLVLCRSKRSKSVQTTMILEHRCPVRVGTSSSCVSRPICVRYSNRAYT